MAAIDFDEQAFKELENKYAQAVSDTQECTARYNNLADLYLKAITDAEERMATFRQLTADYQEVLEKYEKLMAQELTRLKKACVVCGRHKDTRRCRRCEVAMYCCMDCHEAHWPKHKAVCKAPAPVDADM